VSGASGCERRERTRFRNNVQACPPLDKDPVPKPHLLPRGAVSSLVEPSKERLDLQADRLDTLSSPGNRRRIRFDMRLRTKIVVYLVAIHLLFGVAAALLVRESRLWLLALEPIFVLSVVLGYLLVRSLFVPLELVRTGAELMEERDFATSFREVGQPEMDALIRVYNRMVERLREERLRLEEQDLFLDKVLAASPAGVLTLDYDGRVSLLNPSAERLLGLRAEEAAGLRPAELPGSLAPALDRLQPGESQVLPLDGRRRVKASRAEFYDRGFARGFFVLEELTEELRASEKAAYEKLIRMMSHEVNNSVGAVRSLLESFGTYGPQLGAEDRADFAAALEVARTRLEHLRTFMAGFAEMVRLPPPERRPCDLALLLEEILLLLRPELERRRIAVEWTQAAEPAGLLPLDRNQIEQALVNVLKNALEAIGQDGRIELELGREASRPFLAVRDTGGGIAEEARGKLFTPFFSTKRDGRGLGLTLVQEILSQHGFDFRLVNRDRGAEFRIRF
jgi:nitrogen fixation/metabolism regulation signal transduction histidine kinase